MLDQQGHSFPGRGEPLLEGSVRAMSGVLPVVLQLKEQVPAVLGGSVACEGPWLEHRVPQKAGPVGKIHQFGKTASFRPLIDQMLE